MFKKLVRKFKPNPLDSILKRAVKSNHQSFLLAWNRGLGDIALGLYAIVHRIYSFIPTAKITFLIREDLQEGFELLENVDVIIAKGWRRGEGYGVRKTLDELNIDPGSFDVIVDWPDPTYWVKWQLGKLTPRLKWRRENDGLFKKFNLPTSFIGVQPFCETNYALWKDWPFFRWEELFKSLEKRDIKVVLFGFEPSFIFDNTNIIDLRGKTSLFDLLSMIKSDRCSSLIVPDSGILSMVYYLDENFPLKVISLWGDTRLGILKQNVKSPNQQLEHIAIVGGKRDLSKVKAEEVMQYL